MPAPARFHVDVMDGHFVPVITFGPRVVSSFADLVHERGGTIDVHLMIEQPERQLPEFAKAGADSCTVHVETCPHLHHTLGLIHELGMTAGATLNPATPTAALREAAREADLLLCMSVNPGWGGQSFIEASIERLGELRALLRPGMGPRGRRRRRAGDDRALPRGRREPDGGGLGDLRPAVPRRGLAGAHRPRGRVNERDAELLDRALDLAERGRRSASPNPHRRLRDRARRPRAGRGLARAPRRAARRAQRARRLQRAGRGRDGLRLARAVQPLRPPAAVRRRAAGGGASRASSARSAIPTPRSTAAASSACARPASRSSSRAAATRRARAGRTPPSARTSCAAARSCCSSWPRRSTAAPRPSTGESRWISSPESRALVHDWRAEFDAVAVGSGTALADDPELLPRDAEPPAERLPLRVVFDRRGRLGADSKLARSAATAPVAARARPPGARRRRRSRGARRRPRSRRRSRCWARAR